MAKFKIVHSPIPDLLQQMRIKALTTPLAATEMTLLDKDMSAILSQTTLPVETKLKLFYEILNKFQDARSILQHRDIIEKPEKHRGDDQNIQPDTETPYKKKIRRVSTGSDTNTLISTPQYKSLIDLDTPKSNPSGVFEIKQEDVDALLQNRFDVINSKVLLKGQKHQLGKEDQLLPIVQYLLNSDVTDTPRFGSNNRRNNQLTSQIAQMIAHSLIPTTKLGDIDIIYPNLTKYINNLSMSPVTSRLKTKTGKGGEMKVRCNFTKWNKLICQE